ncbi:PEGA domain-containing protein [Candidatus Poribacteria bacterium]|nr:PEGA domain-containing protein [Candidatus Poribacteria bacterium]
MKQILVFSVFLIAVSLITVSSLYAQVVDATTWWLIVSPDVDTRSRSNLDSLVKLLKERGKVPSNHIHRIEGSECTREGMKVVLDDLGSEMGQGDRLIFYFRGFVTKPRRSNSIFFLTYGATPENLEAALQDRQLNGWFRELSPNKVIVILDGYTRDRNLMAYYGNRGMPGSGGFISIQRAALSTEDLLAKTLLGVLGADETDLDNNRQISIEELHISLTSNLAGRALRLMEGVLLSLGRVQEKIFLKLSPMLKVVTVPDGASVLFNGQEVGVTPHSLTDNLQQGTYNVEVSKPGYLIPPARSVEIEQVQGESINLSWDLDSIAVHGSVKAPDGVPLEGAAVWIDGTVYAQNPLYLKADGQYQLLANIANVTSQSGQSNKRVLESGKTYTLRAASDALYHAEANFTLAPHESVERNLILSKKTWFEVAQMQFDRNAYEEAIAAFQNGIEETIEFPPMSPEFTKLLFDSFSEVVDKVNVQNIAYVVVTAKLADRLNLQEESKVYWAQVKLQAAKGSTFHKLATERLRELNWGRRIINIGVLVLFIVLLISGGYAIRRALLRAKT